jgi:hypothetical protein
MDREIQDVMRKVHIFQIQIKILGKRVVGVVVRVHISVVGAVRSSSNDAIICGTNIWYLLSTVQTSEYQTIP